MKNVGFCGTDLTHKKNKQTNLIDSGGVSNMGERENDLYGPPTVLQIKPLRPRIYFPQKKKEGN